ncbi:MAG: alpha/beta hydrolase family protein [Thermomicrobiales bacterium]
MPVRILAVLLSMAAFVLLGVAMAQEKNGITKVQPPYEVDHAKSLEPKESLVAEAKDHTQYRVEFNGIKGDRVPGYLYVPKRKEEKGPFPTILLQYGSGGNKKTDYIVAIGKQFVARGFVVLTIDSINTGERKGKSKTGILGLVGNDQIMHYCGDYSRAVDFLTTRPECDKDRIGYMGLSWGAITGITYVAYDQRIKVMGSMVGGGNFLGMFTKKDAEKARMEVSKAGDPVYHVARIAPRPLLFVNVTKDQLILKSWAESLHQAAGKNSKVVWHDTDHYFRSVDRAAVCENVIDFIAKELNAKKK